MERLTDRQALVLALFNYGLAREPEEVARQLRINVAEAARLCRALVQRGYVQFGAIVAVLAA